MFACTDESVVVLSLSCLYQGFGINLVYAISVGHGPICAVPIIVKCLVYVISLICQAQLLIRNIILFNLWFILPDINQINVAICLCYNSICYFSHIVFIPFFKWNLDIVGWTTSNVQSCMTVFVCIYFTRRVQSMSHDCKCMGTSLLYLKIT